MKTLREKIDKWIDDLADLSAAKPLATVQYKKPMPEVSEVLKVSWWNYTTI